MSSLGFGLGLRSVHYSEILNGQSQADWFEAITENYLGLPGIGPGPALDKLLRIRDQKPIVLHGVALSLGSTDPLNEDYLSRVSDLHRIVEPLWVSDHLCWTGVHGHNSHDLLPLPYNLETVNHVVARVQYVQERWARPLLIENVSSYVQMPESTMTEWDFLREVIQRSGARLLFDVNNVYVSSRNHHFNALDYLNAMPWAAVQQIHLAGHSDDGKVVIDTHDHPVRPEVWALYGEVVRRAPQAATMIEWDANIPTLLELEQELFKAKGVYEQVFAQRAEKFL